MLWRVGVNKSPYKMVEYLVCTVEQHCSVAVRTRLKFHKAAMSK